MDQILNDRKRYTKTPPFAFSGDMYTCWGVMDGHGAKGHPATSLLVEDIPSMLSEELLLLDDDVEDIPSMLREELLLDNNVSNEKCNDEKALKELEAKLEMFANAEPVKTRNRIEQLLIRTFRRAHVHAVMSSDVPAGRSGTTCIVCVLDHECSHALHVATVGDSRAILWNKNNDEIRVLSQETTTRLPEELARIQQCEGRVDSMGNVFYGTVGIAMTRALGDAAMLRAGVIPTPIVRTFELQSKSCHRIVTATDGVFHVLDNNEVKDIVDNALSTNENVQHAADVLAEEAKRKWIGTWPIESNVDDITCTVVQC